MKRNWKIVLTLIIISLIMVFGNYFTFQMTPKQIDAEPNEIITVEKTAYVSDSISTYEFSSDESSETVTIKVPKNSKIMEVKQSGQVSAFGSSGTSKATVESDSLYIYAESNDVENDGPTSTDSDVYTDKDSYYTKEGEEYSITASDFVSYHNSNNYAEAEGTIKVTYKHLEYIDIYKWNEGKCTPEEYRSDRAPDTSQNGVYDTEEECLDDEVVMWKYNDFDCVSEEYRSDLAPEPKGDYYETEQACLNDNFTLDAFENLWVRIKDFFRRLL